MRKDFYKLMLVTQKEYDNIEGYLNFLSECIKGGITSVQLREKKLPLKDISYFAKILKDFLYQYKIPLIINDNVSLAKEIDADGVHLGQDDGNILEARKILGNDKIIGATVNSKQEIINSNKLPIDYIGVGAIFTTKNKPDVKTIWGCNQLKQVQNITNHKIIAIGGINQKNAANVMQTGIDGIAAIGAFHDSTSPYQDTKNLINIINN